MDVPVMRRAGGEPGSRDPALPWGNPHLGERGGRLPALQREEGDPPPPGGRIPPCAPPVRAHRRLPIDARPARTRLGGLPDVAEPYAGGIEPPSPGRHRRQAIAPSSAIEPTFPL